MTTTNTNSQQAPIANRKDSFILLPGDAPKPNTVIFAVYSAALALSKDGTEPTRNAVIEKVLAEYEPPRSRSYNREYLVGYISHGISKGYLIEKEPVAAEAKAEEKKAPAKGANKAKAKAASPVKKATQRAAGEPKKQRTANA